ncbi:MAG: endonuclease/exonuclease/phosphatase family protein [Candidatus Paceibacterota bacterium]|jgi:hypothetical protein
MKIKVLHLNIERDKHLDSVVNFVELHKPDIMCFCEIREKDAVDFSQRFNCKYVYSPLFNTKDGTHGQAIFYRVPILDSLISSYGSDLKEELPFIVVDAPTPNNNRPVDRFHWNYTLLTITIQNSNGDKIIIGTTHFPVADHSTPGYEDHSFDEITDVIDIDYVRECFDRFMSVIRKLPYPLIFTADMNNPRGEYIYDTLAHNLLDLTPIDIESTLDQNLHRRKDLHLVVDTIMTSPGIETARVKIFDGVSDHKALIADVEI